AAGLGSRVRERGRSEAMRAAVVDSALDCVITIDAAGTVLEFNPAATRTFGYRSEEAVGRPLAELIIPPSLREDHRRGLARLAEGAPPKILGRRIELTGMRADGTEFPVELTVTALGEDPPT